MIDAKDTKTTASSRLHKQNGNHRAAPIDQLSPSKSSLDEFKYDYDIFVKRFDALAVDSFKGHEMHQLTSEFLAKYELNFMRSIPFAGCANSRFPNCSNGEANEEDIRLFKLGSASQHQTTTEKEKRAGFRVPEVAHMLANVYRRASQALYLKITFNLWKYKREENRADPIKLARFAIRYDPYDFDSCFLYAMTLGWCLDSMRNSFDRMGLARVFHYSLMRCLQLNPNHAVTYHLLARYEFNIAKLSWIERKLALTMMEDFQLQATYEDSERSLGRAHQLDPSITPNGLWMARVLMAKQGGASDEANRWLELSLSTPSRDPTNEIERLEALELRSKLTRRA